MYLSSTLAQLLRSLRARRGEPRAPTPKSVVHLGVTSLVTDVSSEMIAVVLPLYARYALELSPAVLGALDAAHYAAEAVGRVVMGAIADRTGRLKETALVGYALSLVSRVVLAATGGGGGAIASAIGLDRAGKGLRAAPRDAMIALAAPAEIRATAFAVHRALDTLGSVLGPLLAFALLTLVPFGFDVVFAASAGIALLGLAYFVLFVRSPDRALPSRTSAPPPSERSSADAERSRAAPASFTWIVASGALVSASEVNPGMLFVLVGDRAGLSLANVGLLHVASALACVACVLPFGWAADRWGRGRVLVAGQLALVGAYAWSFASPHGLVAALFGSVLLGAHYAATEGVLVAMATMVLPRERLATGLATLAAVGLIAKVGSAIGFGVVWGKSGADAALVAALVASTGAAVATAIAMGRAPSGCAR